MAERSGLAATGTYQNVACRAASHLSTGDLHLGNLRTALTAWLAARSTGRGLSSAWRTSTAHLVV